MKTLSLELISYQNNDKFPEKLTSLIEKIYEDIGNFIYLENEILIDKSNTIRDIEKLIKDRFNLTVLFDKEFSNYYPAAMIPFQSDYLTEIGTLRNIGPNVFSSLFGSNNIFKHIKVLEKEKEAYFKRIHNRKGFVDLKNARVGGYLADVKNYLIVNFFVLKSEGLTPEEVTAVILHELGHAFIGLETHYRLETTNSTILEILDNINKNKQEKAIYIFKKHFDQQDIEKASLGNNEEIQDFYGKLANAYLGELKSQLVNSKYDETNYENLSDSFAGRFNVSKDLVTGLHKLHLKYGTIIPNSYAIYATIFIIQVMLLGLLLVLGGIPGIALATFLFLFICGNDDTTMTYDFPIERYIRIKNGIINNLKNPNLPDKLTKNLLEQFLIIDNIIQESGYFKGILPTLSDFILPANRDNIYYINLQRKIEDSLNNILFVKSASIRTM